MDIQTEDLEDGTCKVSYFPTVPGVYIVSTKFADEHIPGKQKCWATFWLLPQKSYLAGQRTGSAGGLCHLAQTVSPKDSRRSYQYPPEAASVQNCSGYLGVFHLDLTVLSWL